MRTIAANGGLTGATAANARDLCCGCKNG